MREVTDPHRTRTAIFSAKLACQNVRLFAHITDVGSPRILKLHSTVLGMRHLFRTLHSATFQGQWRGSCAIMWLMNQNQDRENRL